MKFASAASKILLLCSVCWLSLLGCAGDPDNGQEAARRSGMQFLQAIQLRDKQKACSMMHAPGFVGGICGDLSAKEIPPAMVPSAIAGLVRAASKADVQLSGSRAALKYQYSGQNYRLPMLLVDGRWKVDFVAAGPEDWPGTVPNRSYSLP